jgi:hypothetical protein
MCSEPDLLVSLLLTCDQLILSNAMDDDDLNRLLVLLDRETFDEDKNTHLPPGLLHVDLPERVKTPVVLIFSHICDIVLRCRLVTVARSIRIDSSCFMFSFAEKFIQDAIATERRIAQELAARGHSFEQLAFRTDVHRQLRSFVTP